MANRDRFPNGDIVVSGHAQAHLGDSHHYHFYGNPSQQAKYNILYRSLSFDGMDARLRNVEKALSQTCGWLRSHQDFIAWTEPSRVREHHGLLWVKGKPGSGKSTIMKETLEWAGREWTDQLILSYFFNARAPGELEKSSLGLYRSLTHQLLSQRESIGPLFAAEFSSKERDGQVESWTETELQNFLLKLISAGSLPYLNVFIDALDEGEESDIQNLVAFLEKAVESSILVDSVLRLCLSSRHYPQISIEIGLSIVVENQPGHIHDITVYIDKTLPGRNSALMNDIRDMLLRKAGSVFLWVVLSVSMLKPLYNRGRVEAMKRKLEGIPSGLYELFTTIMTKNTENFDECVTLFQWILVSKRPLRPIELYLAIQSWRALIDLDQIAETDQLMVVNYILDCSRGLVELTEGPSPEVQFVHETARQFLISINRDGAQPRHSWSTAFDFRLETCHSVAAEGCLVYLLHVCSKAPLTEEILQEHSLARYAAEYWWQHMQAINGKCSHRVLGLAADLLTGSTANLLTWVQIYNTDSYWKPLDLSLVASNLHTPIYYAAMIGVSELVTTILSANMDVNAQGGHYDNALVAASLRGHEKVVQILLGKGANIDAQGENYGNALVAASLSGHEKVVQILLDKGANVNAQGGDYGNALVAASLYGDENVVQILLDKGANVDVQGGHYGNALVAASLYGDENVVQILLDKGANVNAQGGRYGNALVAASLPGHEKVVQILLDQGANVNAQGGEHGNALVAASVDGHEKVVQILLDQGANVNAQGGEHGNALVAASVRGHEKVVQILLDQGTNVNAQGGEYDNALVAASVGGHEKVVQILLEKGADTDALGKFHSRISSNYGDLVEGNALQAASDNGYKKVMDILLDASATRAIRRHD